MLYEETSDKGSEGNKFVFLLYLISLKRTVRDVSLDFISRNTEKHRETYCFARDRK